MKKISLHIYIVLGLFVVAFILGSIFDQQISQAIFSRDNTFGLVLSAIGTIPGYGCLALSGGALVYLTLFRVGKEKLAHKIIGFALAIFAFGMGVYFSGREFFGRNGFFEVLPKFVGYFIALVPMFGCAFLGFKLAEKSDNPHLWLVLIVFLIAIFLALVPGVTLIKAIFHRPRYRMITSVEMQALDLVGFKHWWERCANYKDIMAQYNAVYGQNALVSEEFKSFPSGHAGASAVTLILAVILPFFNKKYQKIQIPVFYIGLAWCLFICWSRIFVGAHFLSDVSMGAILSLIFALITYFVLNKSKLFNGHSLEEPVEEIEA